MGWRSPVPETRPVAVYSPYAADGTLLYVGSSHDPKRRIGQHARLKSWWPEVARVEVAWKRNRQEAEDAETVGIAVGQPKYNVDRMYIFCKSDDWMADGFREPHDMPGLPESRATVAPQRIVERIGIEPETLFAYAWRVFYRDGKPAWMIAAWHPPRLGTVREDPHRRDCSVRADHRPATHAEAELLGLEAGQFVVAAWRTAVDRNWGNRAWITEVVAPELDLDGASVKAEPARD